MLLLVLINLFFMDTSQLTLFELALGTHFEQVAAFALNTNGTDN